MEDDDDQGQGAADAISAERVRSYLAFARYSIRKRWFISLGMLVVGLVLTFGALKYWPRTFSCSTVLMTLENPVLDGRGGTDALAGAADLILRRENLESMIRSTSLIQKNDQRRPPLLHLKDSIIRGLFGTMDEKTAMAALVGTLESKITVTIEKGDLTIKVEWSDPRTAMELAQASWNSFLAARRTAEVSAFEEKMSILDGHAAKLREEIGGLAQQLRDAQDQKLAQAREQRSEANKAAAAAAPKIDHAPIMHTAIDPDARTPELKTKLAEMQAKLTATETDRDQKLREAQTKFEDLKLRLTPNHPDVVTAGERVAVLQQVPSDVALLRAEVKDLQAEIAEREGFARQGATTIGGVTMPRVKGSTADPLPPDITELLSRDNLDPALSAQLSSAVMKYGTLRDDMLTTHIELDTAEAAFTHRYQVIVPAELPRSADKPKAGAILGGGLIMTLLISLLLPILSELKRGVIVESWQVEHLQLPVLAELHLPPHSSD